MKRDWLGREKLDANVFGLVDTSDLFSPGKRLSNGVVGDLPEASHVGGRVGELDVDGHDYAQVGDGLGLLEA
jgi:hypothetical protein